MEGFLVIEWAGFLGIRPEAVNGGESFKLIASLTHGAPQEKEYYLSMSGIRGLRFCGEAWLKGLYAGFVTRCEHGDFQLNPYALPQTMELQGKDVDDPSIQAGVIDALKPDEADSGG